VSMLVSPWILSTQISSISSVLLFLSHYIELYAAGPVMLSVVAILWASVVALTAAPPIDEHKHPLEQPNLHTVCLSLFSICVPSLPHSASGHADLTWSRRL